MRITDVVMKLLLSVSRFCRNRFGSESMRCSSRPSCCSTTCGCKATLRGSLLLCASCQHEPKELQQPGMTPHPSMRAEVRPPKLLDPHAATGPSENTKKHERPNSIPTDAQALPDPEACRPPAKGLHPCGLVHLQGTFPLLASRKQKLEWPWPILGSVWGVGLNSFWMLGTLSPKPKPYRP